MVIMICTFKAIHYFVFENFRSKDIETYEPDPAHFLSAAGLAWEACLKMTKKEVELLNQIDMQEMAKKEH